MTLIKINTEPVEGMAVTSVEITFRELRNFLFGICLSYLQEIPYVMAKSDTFIKQYAVIRGLADKLNTETTISAKEVRNMIRVLNLRIVHCSEKKEYLERVGYNQPEIRTCYVELCRFFNIPLQNCWESKGNKNTIAPLYYNPNTMELMKAASTYLRDALMGITEDFE